MVYLKPIAIIGSRDFPNLDLVAEFIETHLTPEKHAVVSGLARGVDKHARTVARSKGIHTVDVEALWDYYGKPAGHKRNPLIIQLAETVIAFRVDSDKASNGTDGAIRAAKDQNKPYVIFYPGSSVQ